MVSRKKSPSKKKKTTKRKKTTPARTGKKAILNEFKKIFVGLAVLVSICLTVAMIADLVLQPGRTPRKTAEKVKRVEDHQKIEPIQTPPPVTVAKKKVDGLKAKTKKDGPRKTQKEITYEIYHDIEPVIKERPVKPPKKDRPEIAIIIDDIGYDRKVAMALYDLNPDITFSVLPFSPFGRSLAFKLHEKGAQLMLHLPMEPVEYPRINPGPGAILADMPPDVLLDQLKKDIAEVPYIVGVNNHMGSKLTAHASQMNQIFTILKKMGLFFIDSRTAPKSEGRASARLLKVKFAQRDVFLDNREEYDYIRGQLSELVGLAEKHGFAIGIGHPYKATLQTLRGELPKLKNRVRIVRAAELTHIPEAL